MTTTNDIKQRLLDIAIGLARELAQIRILIEELDKPPTSNTPQ